jgi:uncharacterized protein (TIGR02611 family)
VKTTYKVLRKTIVFLVGSVVIIIGVILLAIPGPGLLTIAAGLIILSTEFEWADRHLKNVKKRISSAYEKTKNKHKKPKDDPQNKK